MASNNDQWRGMRVGLLGGSFNPPHDGHLHISAVALEYLQLDCVWWVVTPQNPLKDPAQTIPYAERIALCRAMAAADPRIVVSDFEQQAGLTRSYDTVSRLRQDLPETALVFLAGTDIMDGLPQWHRWQEIPRTVAMGFVARPPDAETAREKGLALLREQNHQLVTTPVDAPLTPSMCFWMMQAPANFTSSTKIRNINNIK